MKANATVTYQVQPGRSVQFCSRPFINYLLIAANIAVFVLLQGMGANDRFTYAFSTVPKVPKEIVTGKDIVTPPRTVQDPVRGRSFDQPGLQHTPVSVYLTLLVSMFMHGGIAHIAGNMLYLWIFGDNLENALGRSGASHAGRGREGVSSSNIAQPLIRSFECATRSGSGRRHACDAPA